MKRILNLFIVVALASSALMAQQQQPSAADVAALMQKVRDLEDRVVILEGQLRQVKAQQQPLLHPMQCRERQRAHHHRHHRR